MASDPPPQRRPRDRKRQILATARDLFVAQGFPNVTVAQIAAEVGITAGAIYRHFANKTVLLQEVITESFDWVEAPVTTADFEEALLGSLSRVADRPFLSDLWIHEVRYLPEESRRALSAKLRDWVRSIEPAIAQRRPSLHHHQQELLGWGILSLLFCVGRRALRSPDGARMAAVRGALEAIVDADLMDLEVDPGLAGPHPPTSLAPVSTRERILLAAQRQFVDRGYQETTMTSLGSAADVTGPNLYGYFDGKADVLRAVHERGKHALWLSLHDVLAHSVDPREALQQLAPAYVRLAQSWSWAFMLEDPMDMPEVARELESDEREYVAEVVALLIRALPDIDRATARLRVQIAFFLIADLYRVPGLASAVDFTTNASTMALALLLAPADPPA